jgi:hypothetical protein
MDVACAALAYANDYLIEVLDYMILKVLRTWLVSFSITVTGTMKVHG